ncbi:hypothetical protein VTN77DRAFT_4354 [Rasamsonia byssochlamydoides]|uniref:uncharacterized protein n=1 Tax=Rasamsonia byssochlamydoides TaxID=89139 RepID=UPI0037435C80
MAAGSIYSEEPHQIIEGKYVDPAMLMSLLRDVYGISEEGKNNFRVELRLNRYKIYRATNLRHAPVLTEAQISDCRRCGKVR